MEGWNNGMSIVHSPQTTVHGLFKKQNPKFTCLWQEQFPKRINEKVNSM